MSRCPPSDAELNKIMGKITEKEIKDFVAATEKPFDSADLDTISKIAALFDPSDKRSNKQMVSAYCVRACVHLLIVSFHSEGYQRNYKRRLVAAIKMSKSPGISKRAYY